MFAIEKPYAGPCAYCGHPKLLQGPHPYKAKVEKPDGKKADLVLRDYFCVMCDKYTRVRAKTGEAIVPPSKLLDLLGSVKKKKGVSS